MYFLSENLLTIECRLPLAAEMREDGDPPCGSAGEHVDGPAGSFDLRHPDSHAAADGNGRGGPISVPAWSLNNREAAHEQRRGSQAQASGGTTYEKRGTPERLLEKPLLALIQSSIDSVS